MDLERHLKIETPDGVALSLTLAGIGSRILAATVDVVILAVTLGVLAIATGAAGFLSADAGGVVISVAVLLIFLLFIGVPVLFETFVSGRTPGKMAVGIRVVNDDGSPVEVWASTIRNLARFIDLLPFFYAAGLVTMLLTRREQRIGDLMAGTVVIRDRLPTTRESRRDPVPPGRPWDVRQVTDEDMTVMLRFVDRAEHLDREARVQLANRLAGSVRTRVSGVPPGFTDEQFIRGVVAYRRADFGND